MPWNVGDPGCLEPGSGRANTHRCNMESTSIPPPGPVAMSREAAEAFGEGAVHSDDVDALLVALRARLGPSVTVLVKGSRFMRMERVVQAVAATPLEGVH